MDKEIRDALDRLRRWRDAETPEVRTGVYEGRDTLERHRKLTTDQWAVINAALAAHPADADDSAHMALVALYDWYDRDGSVGGASVVFEEHRAALTARPAPAADDAEVARLRKVMADAASAPGRDWLEWQLKLAEALEQGSSADDDAEGEAMKVYVLSTGAHEDWTILGIFSSRERAEKERADYERPQMVEWKDEPHSYEAWIQEVEVDKRIPDDCGNPEWK